MPKLLSNGGDHEMSKLLSNGAIMRCRNCYLMGGSRHAETVI